MEFYKLHPSIHKTYNQNVIDKVEYFWHYWDFIFTQNRDLILVDEPKFTSHISLLNKIEKHLEWNRGVSAKKLLKYFNHHPYFQSSNLIVRSDSELEKHVKILKKNLENCKPDKNKSEHLKEKDRKLLKESFSTLKLQH